MPVQAWGSHQGNDDEYLSGSFRCSAGCPGEHEIWQPLYHCPTCGGLLQVVHDIDALRHRSPVAWMRLFDDRYKRTAWPCGSGVWGKNGSAPASATRTSCRWTKAAQHLLGGTLRRQLGVEDLWVKMCGNSHTGSFKDLGMTVLVSVVKQMIADGVQIGAVACASTGDTSAALAAAPRWIPAVVILPRAKVSAAQLVQPLANGALVLALDTDFDGCMAIVQRLAEEEGVYLANSMNSLRLEGQKTLSIEIVQQFDWEVPDVVIIPGGNLGNVSARRRFPDDAGPRADRQAPAAGARAGGGGESAVSRLPEQLGVRAGARQPTLATAIQIGNPVSIHRAVNALQAFDGIVEQATEDELADASARADRTGMFNCPHTAVALAALELDRPGPGEEDRSGDRRVDRERPEVLGVQDRLSHARWRRHPRHANPPVELPDDYDAGPPGARAAAPVGR